MSFRSIRAPSRPLRALLALLLAALVPIAAAAQGDYRIGAGDTLAFEVLEDESIWRSVLVTPNGEINIPFAGAVTVAGRTLSEVQAELRERLAPNFNKPPTVILSLERPADPPEPAPVRPPDAPRQPPPPVTVAIYALGEVARPGLVEVEPGTTLLQALAQVGGLGPFAAPKRLQLRRRDPHTGHEAIYVLNYDLIRRGLSPNGAVPLADGDVILVPTRRLFE